MRRSASPETRCDEAQGDVVVERRRIPGRLAQKVLSPSCVALTRWIAAGLLASLALGALVVLTLYVLGVVRSPLHPDDGLSSWIGAMGLWGVECVGSILLWTLLARIWPALDRSPLPGVVLFPVCVAAVGFAFLLATGAQFTSVRSPVVALAGLLAFSWVVFGARYVVGVHPERATSDNPL